MSSAKIHCCFDFGIKNCQTHTQPVGVLAYIIRETGAVLELRGAEPSALRRVRERLQAREANATLGVLTRLESCLVSDIELINNSHADQKSEA